VEAGNHYIDRRCGVGCRDASTISEAQPPAVHSKSDTMTANLRNNFRLTFVLAVIVAAISAQWSSANAQSCENGHWIEEVLSDGSVIKLEDGSLWKVDDVDAVSSSIWLPMSEIVACDNKLINTDDNETVAAQRLR
jgi:hypothetical protein